MQAIKLGKPGGLEEERASCCFHEALPRGSVTDAGAVVAHELHELREFHDVFP